MVSRRRNWANPTEDDLIYFRGLDERSKAEIYPWPITAQSHPSIRACMDQCFDCGEFGHRRPCNNPARFKRAPPYKSWRRCKNGLIYTMDKLRMTPAELAMLPTNDDELDIPFNLTQEDMAVLDAIEAGGA
ncbi:hypothetical protein DFH28DRAFT_916837 [Melampsora americana]|nr:hypothetical protein DFH28DRAFT_916837 [Melampsora americana]